MQKCIAEKTTTCTSSVAICRRAAYRAAHAGNCKKKSSSCWCKVHFAHVGNCCTTCKKNTAQQLLLRREARVLLDKVQKSSMDDLQQRAQPLNGI